MSRRLSLKQRRFIDEYLTNGGNATRAALKAYNTTPTVAPSIGSENLRKPAIRLEIERQLGNGLIEQAVRVVSEALHARTANGKPHWVSRLRAADMVFRLTGGYRQNREVVEQEEPKPVISIDWDEVPIEVTKFFAKYKQWPSEEIEKRLTDGETVAELEQDPMLELPAP